MLKSILRVTILGLAVAGFSACEQKKEEASPATPTPNPDLVDYSHLDINIDASKLNDLNRSLGEKISRREKVHFETDLNHTIIKQHIARFNSEIQTASTSPRNSSPDHEVIYDFFIRMISGAGVTNGSSVVNARVNLPDLFELKSRIDKYETTETGNRRTVYNAARTSIIYRLVGQPPALQCYSGTMLFELSHRSRGRSEYLSRNPVVIFTHGHVLPGFMTRTTDGWTLTGIEMTERGRAEIQYGLVSTLHQSDQLIRFIKSDDFIVTEALKDSVINQQEVRDRAIQRAAQAYGFNYQEMETRINNDHPFQALTNTQENPLNLNHSIFAFGAPNTTPGDQEIRESTTPRDGRTVNPGAATLPATTQNAATGPASAELSGDGTIQVGEYQITLRNNEITVSHPNLPTDHFLVFGNFRFFRNLDASLRAIYYHQAIFAPRMNAFSAEDQYARVRIRPILPPIISGFFISGIIERFFDLAHAGRLSSQPPARRQSEGEERTPITGQLLIFFRPITEDEQPMPYRDLMHPAWNTQQILSLDISLAEGRELNPELESRFSNAEIRSLRGTLTDGLRELGEQQ